MITVKLRNNLRHMDDFGTDLVFTANEEKTLTQRDLKSYTLKMLLFKGDLKLTEGDALFTVKHAKIRLSASHPDEAYGLEFGKYFRRNLDTQEITWIDEDKVPTDTHAALNGIDNVPVEDVPVEDVPVEDVPVEDVPVEDVPAEDEPEVLEETETEDIEEDDGDVEVASFTEEEAYALNREEQEKVLDSRGISYSSRMKEDTLVKKIMESNPE